MIFHVYNIHCDKASCKSKHTDYSKLGIFRLKRLFEGDASLHRILKGQCMLRI